MLDAKFVTHTHTRVIPCQSTDKKLDALEFDSNFLGLMFILNYELLHIFRPFLAFLALFLTYLNLRQFSRSIRIFAFCEASVK